MITEDYVSFETAKLLKEKGFVQPTRHYYSYDGRLGYAASEYNWNQTTGYYCDYSCISLPMAMKWLEEKHHILVIPDYIYECTDTSWRYKIYRLEQNGKPKRCEIKGVSYDKDNNPTEHIVGYRDYDESYEDYATREGACDAAIKYCLENLI